MTGESTIQVQSYRLSEALQPFFTTLYATTIECLAGEYVIDCIHPEWAALRFTEGPPPIACIGSGKLVPQWAFVANGPTSQAIHFGVTKSRVWGLRLQPAGWAKFIDHSASALIDRTVDGSTEPAFRRFAPISDIVSGGADDARDIAGKIDAYLLQYLGRPTPQLGAILACQEALNDPNTANVAELSERVGLGLRSLERMCGRYFGFPPKLLLRRQRFLRSLARFMADPSRRWGKALDGQYYDQAQFVRDFRSFMGMSPREYAQMPHPILGIVIAERIADQGAGPGSGLPTLPLGPA